MLLKDKAFLKEFLEEKYRLYSNPKFIVDDPVQIPHRYTKKEDIEIAALFAATLAWGNRKMIIHNLDRLFAKFGDSPYEFVVNFKKKDAERFEDFVHRTFNSNDCIQFIKVLNAIYKLEGGLEKVFTDGYCKTKSIDSAIENYRLVFEKYCSYSHAIKHTPNVSKGSAAKRINLFLRWMVRPSTEKVDFGLWNAIPTSSLMMPLDTHSGRVARSLGLVKRNQNDWKTVVELTECLKSFDCIDPIKYDYALFGLGIYEKFGL